MKKLFCFIVCAVLTALIVIGCKQPVENKAKPLPDLPPSNKPLEHSIIVNADLGEGMTDMEEAFSASGIPYTATHFNNADHRRNIPIAASAKDAALAGKPIKMTVVEPAVEADKPLTITDKGNGNFEIVFKKVTEPVNVKVLFEVEGSTAKRTIEFKVLPEPEIIGLKTDKTEYILNEGASHTLKPILILQPEKIGSIDAKEFLLRSTENIEYEADSTDVIKVSQYGTVDALKPGVSNVTMKTSNGKKTKVKFTVKPSLVGFEIECSDIRGKMYKDEELTFSIKTYSASPESKAVTWSIEKHPSGRLEQNHLYFNITEDGKLTLKDTGKQFVKNGSKIMVVATSKVDGVTKAEKEITVYDNIAEIKK